MNEDSPPAPASRVYRGFLLTEGTLAVVFGVFGLVVLPVRADEAAAGVVLSPLDIVSAVPMVALLLRGWWLLRVSRDGNAPGGLRTAERRTVRRKLRALLGLMFVIGILVPDDWTIVQGVFGVLGVAYGVLVLLQRRRLTRPLSDAAPRSSA